MKLSQEQNIPVTTFTYDDLGFRLSKVEYDSLVRGEWRTWYVRGPSGMLMGIYAEDVTQVDFNPIMVEIPVYGLDRVGMFKPLDSLTYYELKDHLGNVRAVIGGVDSVQYAATMEGERSVEEQQYFDIIKRVPTVYNHTPDTLTSGTANEAIRINNALDQIDNPIGAGIVLRVFPGDTVGAGAQFLLLTGL